MTNLISQPKHVLMDGKLHVYQRPGSPFWQCSTYLGGRNHRTSTKEASLAAAQDFARDWYMERCVDDRRRRRGGVVPSEVTAQPQVGTDPAAAGRRRRTPKGPTFREAAEAFLNEFNATTAHDRNATYVRQKADIVRVHLLPFFGDKGVGEITAGLIQEYRVWRMTSRLDKDGNVKRPARSTLHSETVALRQVLKTANRHGWIEALPDMSVAYKTSGKVAHRAWFSPEEYVILYTATRERAKNPPKPRWRRECEQFHDYVLFMANTGLRPDEAAHLQFRDVKIVRDEAMGGERILEIEVRKGKRGSGYCKSMPGAVVPFTRVQKRFPDRKLTDPVFGKTPRELMNTVLDELNLKTDGAGQPRTCYSLRHTYISMRLMEGADIYALAKNCRTSVEMIERFYASHIKDRIDTTAINMRRAKPEAVRRKVAKAVEVEA